MAGRTPKNTAQDWIEVARRTLVDEGVLGLKIDRLANRLGVTRGGFYHNFRDRDDFFGKLIQHWEETCHFLPDDSPGTDPAEAILWFDRAIARIIESDGYDHRFDLAVREWARTERRAEWAVERADRERLGKLRQFFETLGYDSGHATIRARIVYYHQIGYYAIGVNEPIAERRKNARLYTDILCGEDMVAAARAPLPKSGNISSA